MKFDYIDEMDIEDYALDLQSSALEYSNPVMEASSDADGAGFGILAAGVALAGAGYLAAKNRYDRPNRKGDDSDSGLNGEDYRDEVKEILEE